MRVSGERQLSKVSTSCVRSKARGEAAGGVISAADSLYQSDRPDWHLQQIIARQMYMYFISHLANESLVWP